MIAKIVMYVGTAGTAVWMSEDLGNTWVRPRSHFGLYIESGAWALSEHPAKPGQVLAGTDTGLYEWHHADAHWTHLPSAMNATKSIWAIAREASNPEIMLAGTRPGKVFKTEDGARTWRELPAGIAPSSDFTGFETRVTKLLIDPDDPNTFWAAVEVDGIKISRDAGASWTTVDTGLEHPDIHDFTILHDGAGARSLIYTSAFGTYVSTDEGQSWEQRTLDSPWQYARAIVERTDRKVVFLTNGDGPPGSTGTLWRSRDHCRTWEKVAMPAQFNSTPWLIATNPHDPMLLLLATNLGQMFISQDGGENWRKLEREFGEIRSLLWARVPGG